MKKVKKTVAKSADQSNAKHKKQISELSALWEAKYKVLKGQLKSVTEDAYIHGYRDAIMDQAKLDEAFDKHMESAANKFEKIHLKKLKSGPKVKSTAKLKAQKPKAKTAKKAGRRTRA